MTADEEKKKANETDDDNVDLEKVVNDYDHFMQECLITTGSFLNIDSHTLHSRKRCQQLLFMAYYIMHSTLGALFIWSYTRDDDTRLWINYWFADYNNELGIFGRIINLCYPSYCVYITANKLTLRWFESSGNLGFLTELPSLMRVGYDKMSLLDQEDKVKTALLIKKLLVLARPNILPLTLSVGLYDVIGYAFFTKRVVLETSSSYPVIPIVFGLIRVVLVLPTINYIFKHMMGLTIFFIVTVRYLEASIGNVMRNVDLCLANNGGNSDNGGNSENILKNQRESHVVSLYKELQSLFNNVNQSMRYLVRNMLYFFCVGVTISLTFMTLNIPFLIKTLMILVAVACASCFLGCTLIVARLKTSLHQLYLKLNSLAARRVYIGRAPAIMNQRLMVHVTSLRQKRQRLLAIKELGNERTNGQFVLGLTHGKGGVTSSFQIFNLTLDTVTLTLMVKKFLSEFMYQ